MSSEKNKKIKKNENTDDDGQLMAEMGDRLREIRVSLKMTQEALSNSLKISKPAYVRYETGGRFPPAKMLNRLALKYHVNSDWIISGRGGLFTTTKADADFIQVDKKLEAFKRQDQEALFIATIKVKMTLKEFFRSLEIPVFSEVFMQNLVKIGLDPVDPYYALRNSEEE
ncbi:MAG: helix-turn-helix transcriptional regulator [bacterium]|nr:helix-turn-helix transcriptional regulator [bacterium]